MLRRLSAISGGSILVTPQPGWPRSQMRLDIEKYMAHKNRREWFSNNKRGLIIMECVMRLLVQ